MMGRVSGTQQLAVIEEGNVKRKRRNGRRFTHSVTEVPGRGENGTLSTPPPPPFSTPTVNGRTAPEESRNQDSGEGGGLGWRVVSRPCTDATVITCQASSSASLPSRSRAESVLRKTCFAPHWSADAVNDALERGEVFKARFRVNAYNRHEAYCTIDGVPTDVLINGLPLQNRAVEGDVVAVKCDSPQWWQRMRSAVPNDVHTGPLEGAANLLSAFNEVASTSYGGQGKVDSTDECLDSCIIDWKERDSIQVNSADELDRSQPNGSAALNHVGSSDEPNCDANAIGRLCAMVSAFPLKRPTGKVVAVIEKSPRRDAVVGFLARLVSNGELTKRGGKEEEFVQLRPNDSKYPQMMVPVEGLPHPVKKLLDNGHTTLETELVGARICSWTEDDLLPRACVTRVLGQGSDLEAQICAVLFENSVYTSEFAPESLACLPQSPWEVPSDELHNRRDLRNLCIFTIDPSNAYDLDDALSVERLGGGVFRVGVHIADVSHFVLPDTELDNEARLRSESVYMVQQKLPMLPPLLLENVGLLSAGVDRLTFSIFWDINSAGEVVDRTVERTIIRSCCKLSYSKAQEAIDGLIGCDIPTLSGWFEWQDVVNSVKDLHEVSKILREKRCNDGALFIDTSRVDILFNDCGIPYDYTLSKRTASYSLVEELMILANRTAAEVIRRAFPDSTLLRRHVAPNPRKLRELESFCEKHGFELDTTSSGRLNQSLQKIGAELSGDSALLDILMNYASRAMQRASYVCSTGDAKLDEEDWGHYSLNVPLYTHFTSPLRRYPDILVHRTLAAVVEAELVYNSRRGSETVSKCFTGIVHDTDVAESPEVREALSLAARKHGVLSTESLSELASYCNDRKQACKRVSDSCDVLYMWALLKSKEGLFSEARVLSLGPRFMSVYIDKFAIERRISYDDVQGLVADWLEATSTLVLSFNPCKGSSSRRGNARRLRPISEFASLISPTELESFDPSSETNPDSPFFPLTLRVFSKILVTLHAVGGDDGKPVDIGVRMYVSSYLS